MAWGAQLDRPDDEPATSAYEGDVSDRSLVEDVETLIGDGRRYLESELAFQKSRLGVVAEGAKSIAAMGALAAAFAVLALVGLTVGLIIALTPLITAWGATAVVVGALLIGAFLAVRSATGTWRRMMAAITGGGQS